MSLKNDPFVTAAWEAVKLLVELAEHRLKKAPDSYDATYDATLVHRARGAVAAMRATHPSTGALQRAHDAPAAQPQERHERRHEEGREEERAARDG